MPERFGRYEVRGLIGRGGMATVYRAWDPRFQREVAVKVLSNQLGSDPAFRTRFEREARAVASLEHAAIVPVYDFGEEGGDLYLVMRYLTGGSLADRIAQRPLALEALVPVVRRVASALDHAHDEGIVHRDVKPANILFDRQGEAYLADFGIARMAEQTASLTGMAVVGSPHYMSPEQVSGQPATGASDIYSLGATVFEALAGRPPFQAEVPLALLNMHLHNEPPPLASVLSGCPAAVSDAVARCMAKAPAERLARAGDLAAALAEAERAGALASVAQSHVPEAVRVATPLTPEAATTIRGGPLVGPADQRRGPTTGRPRRRWPVVLGIGGALGAVGVAVLAVIALAGGDPKAAAASPDLLAALSYVRDDDSMVMGVDLALMRAESAALADAFVEIDAETLGIPPNTIHAYADFEGYTVLVGDLDGPSIERHVLARGFTATGRGYLGIRSRDGVTQEVRIELLDTGRVAIARPEEEPRASGVLPGWLAEEVQRGPFPIHSLEAGRCLAGAECRAGDDEDNRVRYERYTSVMEVRRAAESASSVTALVTERIRLHDSEDGEAARAKLARNDDGARELSARLEGREVIVMAIYGIDVPGGSTPSPAPSVVSSPVPALGTGTQSPAVTATPTSTPTAATRYDPDAETCIDEPAVGIDRMWQSSAPYRAVLGEVIEVGIRIKFGDPGESFWTSAILKAPSGKAWRAYAGLQGAEWAYFMFPDDFYGAVGLQEAGAYTVIFESQGHFLACRGFTVS